ncbi:MAG: ecotin family protein [Cocleimonas sp.]
MKVSTVLILFFGMMTNVSNAADHPELKAFPAAKTGMQRLVIVLPHKERGEEDAFKVELLPGKMMLTDGINRVGINSQIKAMPLKGWGYTYYDITGDNKGFSTLIGVPAGTQSIKSFVAGKSLTIRYNSRLPIVIYSQKGMEVRYRIWRTDDLFTTADQG